MIDRRPTCVAVVAGRVVAAEEARLPWGDPAAQWGLGVFETLGVLDGKAREIEAHLSRLADAAQRLAIAPPRNEAMHQAIASVAAAQKDHFAWLKIVLSRSGTWSVFAGAADAAARGRAVSVVLLPARRHRLDPTVGIKSIACAASMLGLEQAAARSADEGLWLNDRGHLIGACAANVFVVRGRVATTPSLSDGARDGVTRARAISALREAGIIVREGKVRVTGLRHADEIFLTSSVLGVRSAVRLDGRDVRGGRPGRVARMLVDRLG